MHWDGEVDSFPLMVNATRILYPIPRTSGMVTSWQLSPSVTYRGKMGMHPCKDCGLFGKYFCAPYGGLQDSFLSLLETFLSLLDFWSLC